MQPSRPGSEAMPLGRVVALLAELGREMLRQDGAGVTAPQVDEQPPARAEAGGCEQSCEHNRG